jgi:hypothetical protein
MMPKNLAASTAARRRSRSELPLEVFKLAANFFGRGFRVLAEFREFAFELRDV